MNPQSHLCNKAYLRHKYHLGPIRIGWYLARYHDIKISDAGVYRILRRNGFKRLPRGTRVRKLHTKRYQKQVPGHDIQVDVKFLTFTGKHGEKVRRFQYTEIDDATRFRTLKFYDKHTQANAIEFIDHIIEKFPFRIREVRTDNGHEFQAKFHWHVGDKGIRRAYIKRGTPQLNGKVERSHRSDQQVFCQLLSYKGDVDLEAKLDEWERFYNFARPHGAHKGQSPYEALRDKLQWSDKCPTAASRLHCGAVVVDEIDDTVRARTRNMFDLLQVFDPDAVLTEDIWAYLWGKLG